MLMPLFIEEEDGPGVGRRSCLRGSLDNVVPL